MTVSLLNCLLESPSLQKKEEKVPGKDRSRTAATGESVREEFPSVDEEAREAAAEKEEVVRKEAGGAKDTVLSARETHNLHNKLQNMHRQPNRHKILARARQEAKDQKAPREKGAKVSLTKEARAKVCVISSRRQGVAPELIVVLPTPVEGARWLDPADNHTGALLPIMKKQHTLPFQKLHLSLSKTILRHLRQLPHQSCKLNYGTRPHSKGGCGVDLRRRQTMEA